MVPRPPGLLLQRLQRFDLLEAALSSAGVKCCWCSQVKGYSSHILTMLPKWLSFGVIHCGMGNGYAYMSHRDTFLVFQRLPLLRTEVKLKMAAFLYLKMYSFTSNGLDSDRIRFAVNYLYLEVEVNPNKLHVLLF